MALDSMTLNDITRNGTTRNGTTRNGMTRNRMTRNGMTCSDRRRAHGNRTACSYYGPNLTRTAILQALMNSSAGGASMRMRSALAFMRFAFSSGRKMFTLRHTHRKNKDAQKQKIK